MILDYLNVEQTIKYLKSKTGFEHSLNELINLNYTKKLDFCFKRQCSVYTTSRLTNYSIEDDPDWHERGLRLGYYYVSNANYINGLFKINNILSCNIDSKTIKFKHVNIELIYEQYDLGLDVVASEDYISTPFKIGDTVYLSSADCFDFNFYPTGEVDNLPFRLKATNKIDYKDVIFKKSQLDELIRRSINNAPTLDEIDELKKQISSLEAENLDLQSHLENECAKPSRASTDTNNSLFINDVELNTRSRNIALKIMYALLIKSGLQNISPTSNEVRDNANTEIGLLLDELGISVGTETIGKYLKDIKLLESEFPYENKQTNSSN